MDLYIVLGVRQDASESDIKRAYRRLARRHHPDINPGDQASAVRFREALEAYETLIDRQRRLHYDAGYAPPPPEGSRTEFAGFDFTATGSSASATFGDLFAEVLVGRAVEHASAPESGADHHQDLHLSFEDAFVGIEEPLTVTRREVCRRCAGAGVPQGPGGPCGMCHGSGALRSVRGHMVFSRSCHTCGGTGQRRPDPCQMCGGSGRDVRSERVIVRIPAGVADLERVRVPGKGDAGLHGASAGDLYVTVHVAPHQMFRREGDDIHVAVPVAIHEAALGGRITVQTPDQQVSMRVPPGTQSGQRFRLKGRGAVSSRRVERGDLVVEIRLMLPPLLDERSKELLREFGRINGASGRAEGGHGETN